MQQIYWLTHVKNKDDSHKQNKENFNSKMKLTDGALLKTEWQKMRIFNAFNLIRNPKITKYFVYRCFYCRLESYIKK